MERWVGATAIVTGATAGIGAALSETLVKSGINVVGLARRLNILDQIADKLTEEPAKFYPIQCDVANEDDILKAFSWIEDNLGGVSIMVNNAGVLFGTKIINGDANLWKKTMDINVLGLSICTREAIKSMRKHNIDGQIIHINSIAGHYVPMTEEPCLNVYAPSKHAVTAATETLRKELNYYKSKIKVTSISPGLVATDFFIGGAIGGIEDPAEAGLPVLWAQDIVETCLYVLSTPPHCQVHDVMIRPIGEQI